MLTKTRRIACSGDLNNQRGYWMNSCKERCSLFRKLHRESIHKMHSEGEIKMKSYGKPPLSNPLVKCMWINHKPCLTGRLGPQFIRRVRWGVREKIVRIIGLPLTISRSLDSFSVGQSRWGGT